jgi:STE24 endopeptidase
MAILESLLGLAGLTALVAVHAARRGLAGLRAGPWPLQVVAVVSALVVAATALEAAVSVIRLRHERRWGFARQTNRVWTLDRLKGLAVSLVLGNGLALGFYAVVWWTTSWWIVAWAASVAWSVAMAMLVPTLLAPLFNRFRPLDDAWLAERTAELGRRAGVRIRQVLVMDASRRTSKHNAYFTGLGRTKRVVLWDTLLNDVPPPAALAVVAHELSHWRHRHGLRMLAVGAVAGLAVFAVLQVVLTSTAVQSLGGFGGPSDPAGAPVALLVMVVAEAAALPASLWLTRAWERQADADAVTWSGDADAVLAMHRELALKNLGALAPSRLAYLLSSHPPAAERLALAAAIRAAMGA